MEITQKKKPPGSLDNLHPGIEPQSTFLYLSGYFIMKTDHHRCFCCNSRIRVFIPSSLLITAINCSLH
ncbi:hypothetical protein F6I15_14175 [Escherichia coli]|nr:hypothetical protein F6I15_14175 [Escherichia coli]RRM50477.1 hypothetical protein DU304_04190 [Escherichia coli]